MLFNMGHKASGTSVLISVEIGSVFPYSRSEHLWFYLTIPQNIKDYCS